MLLLVGDYRIAQHVERQEERVALPTLGFQLRLLRRDLIVQDLEVLRVSVRATARSAEQRIQTFLGDLDLGAEARGFALQTLRRLGRPHGILLERRQERRLTQDGALLRA